MSQFSLINIVFLATETVLWKQDFCDTRFTGVPSNWQFQKVENPIYYFDCNGVDVFGGYGTVNGSTIITGHYENLPLHYEITVKFTTYALDSWDTESVFIDIDGHKEKKTVAYYDDEVERICGHPFWNDTIISQSFTYPHTNDTLKLVFTFNFDESTTNESWGMRDFSISIRPSGCIQFYSECNYQGIMKEICQNFPNQERTNFPETIKSIKFINSVYLELQKTGFEKLIFTKDVQCLDNYSFLPIEYFD